MEKTNKGHKRSIFGLKMLVKVLIVVVLVIIGFTIGSKTSFTTESKTTKLSFDNIGELATQEAYATEVNHTEDARELFGVEIPLTKSTHVYSYDVIIKAGFNFEQIKPKVDQDEQLITIEMPEVKILSNEIVEDSLKVYVEDESIFKKITLEDTSEARKTMKENAEKSAIEKGLFKSAKTNAETLLKNFIKENEVYKEYQIEFVYKEK
ncbi:MULTISPECIES: DUF4230 domain-containing protein [unclassified Breznakia]|uniref:DUF4230 domain-containing protein n=1 Tax=unclassified Breznakia TaxID=2623764 RepID=UPI0024745EDB|nr:MULTISPECIES: DUF4230 domain-containing protein [unclassified Breznakia]MDH6366167.1 hypothetical protein [Breznakia sp. PH1-1]MDH6403260.1 hypothetical protein [Breznakia sp. PF1-11]MDH6410969.1 hypothetical protein [Breznakia sp. PFB1-11]MDH6413333.1 hypothetical protein [Breznakia sp. PFB1-14]MDH6416098.1 hypothetical protein [Breznakia sp. PFB1-4]